MLKNRTMGYLRHRNQFNQVLTVPTSYVGSEHCLKNSAMLSLENRTSLPMRCALIFPSFTKLWIDLSQHCTIVATSLEVYNFVSIIPSFALSFVFMFIIFQYHLTLYECNHLHRWLIKQSYGKFLLCGWNTQNFREKTVVSIHNYSTKTISGNEKSEKTKKVKMTSGIALSFFTHDAFFA